VFTGRQYHALIRAGIIEDGEPYELLSGQIVRKDPSAYGEDPLSVGLGHTYSVGALVEMGPRLQRRGCYMRCQLPITLPEVHEPVPDGVIVRGGMHDYAGRHPHAADILCVIEVGDAALRRDRNVKLPIYANAGIKTCVIVNLMERDAEVYCQPLVGTGRYARADTLPESAILSFPTTKTPLKVPIRELLPPLPSTRKRRRIRRR
jgi:Uma2 family endonuclease